MFNPVIINYKYNNYVYVLTVAAMCLLSCMHLNRNCFCSKEFVLQESHETKGLESSPSITPFMSKGLEEKGGKGHQYPSLQAQHYKCAPTKYSNFSCLYS